MSDTIQYFGYGANRDPEMMRAIVGRVPEGKFATVSGFELCVQNWDCIPEAAQHMLSGSWDETFRSYVLRPTTNSSTKKVRGMIWKLTPEERRLVDNWELTGQWYHVFRLQSDETNLEIQVVENQPVSHVVRFPIYKTFLNDKKKMLRVAEKARKWYLEQ